MPYHVFRHLSAITAVRPKPNDVTCAYQAGGREGRVGQRGQKEILPEGGIDQMYWSQWRWGIEEGREGGRGGGGQAGGREGRVGQRGQKEILPGGQNLSNVLILMKVRHWGGGGREGRAGEGRMEGREILPGGGIDQMYWSKWRWGIGEGVHLQTWGSGAPYGGGGREGGRREGGYRLIISVSWLSTTETHAHVTSHFRWPG